MSMEISREIKDEIVEGMAAELYDRNYDFDKYVLSNIVDLSTEKKDYLINLFSNHPNWNSEKLMIQFDTDIERKFQAEEIRNFAYWLKNQLRVFWYFDRKTEEDERKYLVCDFINSINQQFFDEKMQDKIDMVNSLNPKFKLRNNMKASKAIGKICKEEGWDKLEDYNKKYANLCDALSPLKIRRHTVISLNPIDFLLMSNGNSWDSCHDIGKSWDAGCYSSGTISYMLDEHSFVFYTVNADYNGNEIERQPKIQRQVFGYNDEVLAQLRLYPKDNDYGAEQTYTDIREIVQKVIADCLNKPNLWIRSTNNVEEIVKLGYGATCYPDWKNGNPGSKHCSVSTLKDRENGKEFRNIIFGAMPICIDCGEEHSHKENISCCQGNYYECEICGHRMSENEVCWGGTYGDIPYCSDCCTYCEECDNYYPNDDVQEIDGRYICDHCISSSCYYYTCEACGEIHHEDYVYFTENGDCYCEDCVDENTFECNECGCRFINKYKIVDEDGNEYCTDCYDEIMEERESISEEVI